MAGTEAVIETCDGMAEGRIRVFVTPFTIVPSLNPSSPTPPELATHLTSFDRLQARKVRELAAKWHVRIHSDAFGGMVRLAQQDEHALLGPDVHLQHCMGLSDEEVQILAETGTHVGHAAGGRAPVLPMMAAGVTVAVTTDGASRRPFDLLQAARAAQAAQQLFTGDPWILPTGKLLEMITIDAARVMGLDHEIGSLEVGKKADVIVIDMRQPHLTPAWMPVHRLIYQGSGSDVETVVVNGRVVMDDRVVQTVDVEAILDEAQRESAAFIDRSGFDRFLTQPSWGRLRLEFDEPIDLPTPPDPTT
jgi:cytosine/adenosine deaminase-related metal-dependent hydrolase